MATIASVDVALTASSVDLRRGLDRAGRATRNYTSRAQAQYQRLQRNIRNTQRAFVGFAAALGVGAILRNVDELQKLSDGTGVTFERFQRLQFAFQQTGVEGNTTARILQRVGLGIEELREGTGETGDAIERLGLTLSELGGLGVDQQLFAIFDALNMVTDESRRSALAAEIFGARIGIGLGSALEQGSAGLNAVAASLSSVVSESDARSIEEFNDSLNELGTVATALLSRIAPVLNGFTQFVTVLSRIPGIGALITAAIGGLVTIIGVGYVRSLLAATTGTRAYVATLTQVSFLTAAYGAQVAGLSVRQNALALSINGLTRSVAVNRAAFAASIITFRTVNAALRGVGAAFRFALGPVGLIIIGVEALISIFQVGFIGTLRRAQNVFIFFLRIFQRGLNLVIGAFGGATVALSDYVDVLDNAGAMTSELTANTDDLLTTFEGGNTAVLEFATSLRNLTESLFPAEAANRQFTDNLAILDQALATGTISTDRYREAVALLTEGYTNQIDALMNVETQLSSFQQTLLDAGDLTNNLSELGSRAFDGLSDSLTDFLTTGKTDFRGFAQELIRGFIRIQAQAALAGIFGGASGGLGFFGDIFRQNGGPVNAGQPYIVGEAGPELFVPGNGGQVVSNNRLEGIGAGGGGGGGGNITINAIDTQSFQQALARDPEFLSAVVQRGNRTRR